MLIKMFESHLIRIYDSTVYRSKVEDKINYYKSLSSIIIIEIELYTPLGHWA